ncbi:helix-turn-helix domain-containing protein [Aliiglaciecola sp. LCG003]|uniref:GlxA family transcriptional regulator n=1 Tax=Aliiglaciecola sp. LCG003 TaxID=3053655 RepID=UPI0025723715|nr:helix-turn-helix domain-containing protein [Aliiglaciecola sp. LCG003]WJG11066.1 helix-turn-helix domain-containing protein [Aliiglaciecola sp. LCG003]
MNTVTILGYSQAYASAITGALDLFALAGVTCQRMQGLPPQQRFSVQLASVGGKDIECINQLTLKSHIAIEDVNTTDLLIIPTIGGKVENVLDNNRNLLPFIQHFYRAGADIASNCSGAFFLAEAGILNERTATTHWGYADLFSQRYPQVKLQPNQLITQDGNLYCSGGGMAWFDLALLLIERYCGHDVATDTAKAHVLDLSRGNQAAYAQLRSKKYHQDSEVLVVQEWLENHYYQVITLNKLAEQVSLTTRTLLRRFKIATEQTPFSYLQSIRVEAAKKLLETESHSLETITGLVGYEDLSSFTRLFKSVTGLSPSQYRKKFIR